MELRNKIDFMGLISVVMANPNGDPLNGGFPRTDSSGYGIITDVCFKRKLRNRLSENGENILITPQTDLSDCIASRLKQLDKLTDDELPYEACRQWYDVRAFGQVFFGVGRKSSRSCFVKGAVSVSHALSVHPVELVELPVTCCINGKSSNARASDTLGMRIAVRYGLYIMKGSVNAAAAHKTGFSHEDAQSLKAALCSMFANDASAARPEGSMTMERLYWWEHSCITGDYPSRKVFDTIKPQLCEGIRKPLCFSDYIVEEQHLNGLLPEIIC